MGNTQFIANPRDRDTVTLPEWDGASITNRVFEFLDFPDASEPPFEVQIGVSATATRDNMKTKMDALILASTIGDFQPVSNLLAGIPNIDLTQVVGGTGGNVSITKVGTGLSVGGFSGGTDVAFGTRGRIHFNGVKVAFSFASLPATFPTPVTYIGDQDFIPHVMVEAQTDGAAI